MSRLRDRKREDFRLARDNVSNEKTVFRREDGGCRPHGQSDDFIGGPRAGAAFREGARMDRRQRRRSSNGIVTVEQCGGQIVAACGLASGARM